MKALLQRRLLTPLLALLMQGVTPRQVALSLAVGAVVGTFPVLGTTTVFCAVIAMALRLNMVAIQLVNWFIYPLQILLLIPFYRLGAILFAAPRPAISTSGLVDAFRNDPVAALRDCGGATLHAASAWSLAALPCALVLYSILRPLMDRLMSRHATEGGAA